MPCARGFSCSRSCCRTYRAGSFVPHPLSKSQNHNYGPPTKADKICGWIIFSILILILIVSLIKYIKDKND